MGRIVLMLAMACVAGCTAVEQAAETPAEDSAAADAAALGWVTHLCKSTRLDDLGNNSLYCVNLDTGQEIYLVHKRQARKGI